MRQVFLICISTMFALTMYSQNLAIHSFPYTNGTNIISDYGWRSGSTFHAGIDIPHVPYDPIFADSRGYISKYYYNGLKGICIMPLLNFNANVDEVFSYLHLFEMTNSLEYYANRFAANNFKMVDVHYLDGMLYKIDSLSKGIMVRRGPPVLR